MISIIIPIYNLENYIGRCLDSVISQTYKDLEIICIDDGSTDNSAAICKEYMKNDIRVRYYYIPNGGVSNARNYALTLITGQWFAFLDGDDWIEPDYFEVLMANAINNQCEISACQYQISTEYKLGYHKDNNNTLVLNSSEECIHNFICGGNSLQGQIWNKIYLTRKFKDILFDKNVKVNEDCLYTYEVMKRCTKACVSEAKMYHWYVRETSACRKKYSEINFDDANVFLYLINETEKIHDREIEKTLKKNYVIKVLKTLYDTKRESKRDDISEALKNIKSWKNDVWETLSGKTKLKYYLVMIKYIV